MKLTSIFNIDKSSYYNNKISIMSSDNIENKFKNALKKEGFKVTPQRIAIFHEMTKDQGHRESDEIYSAIKKLNINVSRATLYRTLDILVKNNFVRKLNIGDGKARYENKVDSQHHDHMICNSCGEIIEFVNLEIERLQDIIARESKFILTSHIHQLFGICSKCQ